jgi:hypothetical protein
MRIATEPSDLAVIGTLAEGDPARELIAEILSVVRVSVLDKELNLVLTWGSEGHSTATAANHLGLRRRLPTIIEQAVREIIVAWTSDPARERMGASHPVSFLTVREQGGDLRANRSRIRGDDECPDRGRT